MLFQFPRPSTCVLKFKKLGKPLTKYDYLRIPITLIPENIIQQYNSLPLVRNKFIYLDICKGVYGLPQVGRLAKDLLTKSLESK